jgi:low affinity Fe/Cu permease
MHVNRRIALGLVGDNMTQTNGARDDRGNHARAASLTAKFSHFAQQTAIWTGHPWAFLMAAAVIVVWVVTGPIFHYSDTWQLVINTGTTIVTFLMVFLIQNTQNRDMMAVQLKLSELVIAMKGAKNSFASIEDLTDEELQALHVDCRQRAEMAEQHIEHRQSSRPALAVAAKPPVKRAKSTSSTKRAAAPGKA